MRGKTKQQIEAQKTALGLTEWLAITMVFVLSYVLCDALVTKMPTYVQIALFGGCLGVLVLTGYFRHRSRAQE